jgi:hypothetical protein
MAETEEGRKFEKIALDYLKQNNLSEAEFWRRGGSGVCAREPW